MGWDGAGNVVRGNGTNSGVETWKDDKEAGIKITSENHDIHDEDMAQSIANCIAKDGQNEATADLNMGGFRMKNAAAATAATDFVIASQIQKGGLHYAVAAGTVDVMTATLTPAIDALTNGLIVVLLSLGGNNTTTPTLNLNGLGAKTIVKGDDQDLVADDTASILLYLVYSVVLGKFILLNPQYEAGIKTYFKVYRNLPQTINNNSSTILQFNQEDSDDFGDYNPATYTFTVPREGFYVFHLQVTYLTPADQALLRAEIRVNNSTKAYVDQPASGTLTQAVAVSYSSTFSGGETVTFFTTHTSGGIRDVSGDIAQTFAHGYMIKGR